MTQVSPKRPPWVTWILVGIPLWLAVSGGLGVWHLLHREKQQTEAERERFTTHISAPLLADDLKKIVEIIGERHGSSANAAANLSRMASMIEGALGPSNTGYTVARHPGPADWPLLEVSVPGKNRNAAPVWVLTSYDSRPGSKGIEANSTGLASTLSAAYALAGDKPEQSIHFVFLPHGNDPESPILETIAAFQRLAGKARITLCVEAMGAGEELWLSSRDSEALPLSKATGLGSVRGAETICLGEDVDLASLMSEAGIPAVRVATRPLVTADETDALPPDPAVLAASTGRLVELIRRCAMPGS